jgi:virulence-associated protein VagC
VIDMPTAKIFTTGKSQAVRLPMDKAWDNFLSVEPVTDDFREAVIRNRDGITDTEREQM